VTIRGRTGRKIGALRKCADKGAATCSRWTLQLEWILITRVGPWDLRARARAGRGFGDRTQSKSEIEATCQSLVFGPAVFDQRDKIQKAWDVLAGGDQRERIRALKGGRGCRRVTVDATGP